MSSKVAQAYIQSLDLGASGQTAPLGGLGVNTISHQLVWTGTPTGTFKVQASNNYNVPNVTATWNDVPSASIAGGGAAGSQIFSNGQATETYYRIDYARTSGSGTLALYTVIKSNG